MDETIGVATFTIASDDPLDSGNQANSDDAAQRNPSRFKVAKVEFVVDEPSDHPDEEQDGHAYPPAYDDGISSYDTQGQKTFGRNTLETLPHIDHYRNLLSTTGGMRKRPTLLELHDIEVAEAADQLLNYDDKENGDSSLKVTVVKEEAAPAAAALKFGWIQGVLVRCVLNIFGVMLFLRLSWVVGQGGIGFASIVILLASVVTILTALSMSAICTNGLVRGGGAYYMISRSLGPEFGGAIGIVFSVANAVAVAMYVVGFAETIRDILQNHGCLMVDEINDVRIIGLITAVILMGIAMAGLSWEAKAQLVLLAILVIAILNFIIGTLIPPTKEKYEKGFVGYSMNTFRENFGPDFREEHTFFSVFAIYFPAATGILAGANISGDLKDAQKAIPKGTLLSILVTTLVYLAIAWMTGWSILRDAAGPVAVLLMPLNETYNGTLMDGVDHLLANIPTTAFPSGDIQTDSLLNNISMNLATDSIACVPGSCKYGLHNDMQVMQMVSAFGPLTIAGIVSATLSSALASLVSAPRVFQAVCKDKIFPHIHIFAKGYGKAEEPRRAYALAFGLALACICIGDLNAIAPLISNFFLMSYALVNYSCFDASLAKSPGWRPAFKYYSMWLSLAGALLCVSVMFIINWWTALITIAIVAGLFFYVHYRKPDINWGSSTQAHVYKNALQNTHKLLNINEHVKNFRPQVLVLTGSPMDRKCLVDFSVSITKNVGLMVCGHIILGDPEDKLIDLRWISKKAYIWLTKRKTKSFYSAIMAPSLRLGVQSLLQSAGLGKLKPNTLLIGFKSDWHRAPASEVAEYFGMINDAFDLRYGVGILRLRTGLDLSHLSPSGIDGYQRLHDVEISVHSGLDGPPNEEKHMQDDVDHNDEDKDDDKEEEESDDEQNDETKQLPNNVVAKDTRNKGFIDVWWLFDDGGLTLLIPYILTTKKQWKGCKLRVYMAGSKKSALDRDQRHMATLLSKFRIEYSSMTVLPDFNKQPTEESMVEFNKWTADWMLKSSQGETEESHPWKISEEELLLQKDRTHRHVRTRELMLQHSKDAKLIVMTLPMPRKGICSAGLYMAWIDTLTRDMPPILLLRGNQENVLTYYS